MKIIFQILQGELTYKLAVLCGLCANMETDEESVCCCEVGNIKTVQSEHCQCITLCPSFNRLMLDSERNGVARYSPECCVHWKRAIAYCDVIAVSLLAQFPGFLENQTLFELRIVTDNANNFVSAEIKNLALSWRGKLVQTTPYYPKANLVEQHNRNLKVALRSFQSKTHRDRDIALY
ncbi:hypothetical protein PR048_009016 [Dryococelus australis]|uniref:Integrase catalytic domain-containing protein n=1 Tax=Dryococelus australis TaxID=614101 RepID=A0ABQ9HYQ1_9NEOP|nr:hypothetical protein PR048_009016 [Dryococelus australis]